MAVTPVSLGTARGMSRPAGTALTLALIAISGNPVFSGTETAPAVIALLIAMVLVARGGSISLRFLQRYALIAAGFIIIFLAHQIQFGLVSVAGSVYLLVKLFAGGLIVSHLGEHFAPRFFDATFLLCA